MMKKISLLCLALSVIMFFASCESTVIARIEFSGDGKTAEMRHIEYDLSYILDNADELSASLKVPPMLKNVNPKIDYGKLLSAFGMTGAEYEKFSDPSGRKYKLGTKTMIVYDAGFISYTDTSLYEMPLKWGGNIMDETEYLAGEAGLDISGLSYDSTYQTADTVSVTFKRRINGVRVVGRTGITAEGMGDGFAGFYYLSSAYSSEREFEPVSLTDAVNELLTEKSSQSFGREIGVEAAPIETVKVTGVEIVYWDSAYTQTKMNQTYIQPVYCFTGECTDCDGSVTPFVGYVRAVPDTITTDFHVEDLGE